MVTIVNGYNVTNAYYVSKDDLSVCILESNHNNGYYATNTLIDTRFIPELQNFVWTSGYKPNGFIKPYLSAHINQTNRQVLDRLRIVVQGTTLLLHKFIVMLETKSNVILKINHIGKICDNRIKNLQWVTQNDYNTNEVELDFFLDRQHIFI